MQRWSQPSRILLVIRVLHTILWGFFVACLVSIPLAAAWRKFFWAEALTAVMLAECAVLALNRGRCPLTELASRYTVDRRPNFDIYLPEWLARHNKAVFGALFAADLCFLAWQFAT